MDNKVEYNGRIYLVEDLSEAFDKVANPEDWKAPIDATVSITDIREGATIKAAVEFYTATKATIKLTTYGRDIKIHVTSDGYRMGPAGP